MPRIIVPTNAQWAVLEELGIVTDDRQMLDAVILPPMIREFLRNQGIAVEKAHRQEADLEIFDEEGEPDIRITVFDDFDDDETIEAIRNVIPTSE